MYTIKLVINLVAMKIILVKTILVCVHVTLSVIHFVLVVNCKLIYIQTLTDSMSMSIS